MQRITSQPPIAYAYINPIFITNNSNKLNLRSSPPNPYPNSSLSFNPKKALQELDTLADSETKNRDVVLKLYDALRSRDVASVHKTLTPDLDYWFHGPPPHQFLMRTLTGVSPPFEFSPLSVVSFGSTVVAEGCDAASSVSWIHAWTVSHGVITQVREYSNTSLTVTRIGGNVVAGRSAAEIKPSHCPSVWESKFSGGAGKSVPGLVLAI